MDEPLAKMARKTRRQLRLIEWLLMFIILLLLALGAIFGFMAYEFVGFSHDVNKNLSGLQQTTKQATSGQTQLCNDSLSSLLPDICQ